MLLYEPFDEEDGQDLTAGQIGVLFKKTSTSDDDGGYEEDIFALDIKNLNHH